MRFLSKVASLLLQRWLWAGLGRHLRQRFTVGLFLLVPILFTYFVLSIFFDFLDSFLGPLVNRVLDRWTQRDVPGVGLIALLITIYVSGLIATNLVGRRFFVALQHLFLAIPIVRTVYSVGKQITDSLSGSHPTGLKRVVALEYPRPGLWAIGFLTGFSTGEDGSRYGVVYIPTAPLPNSGWLAIVSVAEIYDTDMTVQAAMQFVLSGGIMYPHDFQRRPLPEANERVPAISS